MSVFRNQKIFDEDITKQGKNVVKLMNDEQIDPTSRLDMMIRKSWFRGGKGFAVLHLGSGKDKICEGFTEWKIIRADREEYEGTILLDINKEYKRIPEICRENDIKMIIMEGLTYYLEKEVLEFIIGLIKRRMLLFILDGINEEAVAIFKHLVQVTTPLPLELLPSKSKVITSKEMNIVFGNYTTEVGKSTIFYVLNF